MEKSIGIGDDKVALLDDLTSEEALLWQNGLLSFVQADVARSRTAGDVVSKVSLSNDYSQDRSHGLAIARGRKEGGRRKLTLKDLSFGSLLEELSLSKRAVVALSFDDGDHVEGVHAEWVRGGASGRCVPSRTKSQGDETGERIAHNRQLQGRKKYLGICRMIRSVDTVIRE
jgi:hypothetical protein